jgi:hypothetical protein
MTEVIAALIAATAVLVGYLVNQISNRRLDKTKVFAAAIEAVADYQEMPYRIRRQPSSDAATRVGLAERVSDIQKRIDFHRAWLRIESEEVGNSYDDLVASVRREAGQHMKNAWGESLITSDDEMSLGVAYACPETEKVRAECLKTMQAHLKHWWQ